MYSVSRQFPGRWGGGRLGEAKTQLGKYCDIEISLLIDIDCKF